MTTTNDLAAAFAALPESKQRAALALALCVSDVPDEFDELPIVERILGMAWDAGTRGGVSPQGMDYLRVCRQMLHAEYELRQGASEAPEAAPEPESDEPPTWDSTDDAVYLAGLPTMVVTPLMGLVFAVKDLTPAQLTTCNEMLRAFHQTLADAGHEQVAKYVEYARHVSVAVRLARLSGRQV